MSNIIYLKKEAPSEESLINARALRKNAFKLRSGLIAPATEETHVELAADHTSEPIKSLDDIYRISEYLVANGRWRDNMLFIVGINFGLRVSDLITLRFNQLINDDLTFKDRFPILEKKTKNTRKVQKNRYITINEAVVEAVTLYLEHTVNVRLSDYLFRSHSNHGRDENNHIHRNTVDKILKGIGKDLGLEIQISTHTLRKTFAYHQMLMSNNDPRKLMLLSKMMGHSSIGLTLDYIGLTREEMDAAYRELNLGCARNNHMLASDLLEIPIATA